jgi:hypothetical protein
MHNSAPERPTAGLAQLCMTITRNTARPEHLPSIAVLCMLCEAASRRHPSPAPLQVPAVENRSALDPRGLSDPDGRARTRGIRPSHVRRTEGIEPNSLGGTGPMDAERGEAPKSRPP